jgi:Arc/MetJ-type ribon-helix-helix transcriptional regulator
VTIHLPDDLERFIRAEVRNGHFASENDAVAEAVRLLRSQIRQAAATKPVDEPTAATAPDAYLGSLRDAADEIDDIVVETMKLREQQPWRLSPGE